MSSDLSTELSTLRTLIITAKDDITRLRDSYDPTAPSGHWGHFDQVESARDHPGQEDPAVRPTGKCPYTDAIS